MTIDLTALFQSILALLAAIITYKVIPWIKARTTNEQQTMMRAAVKTLVYAAEQLYGAGNGSEKLDFVIKQLEAQGYTVNRVEIEAAVGEYLNNCPTIEAVAQTGEAEEKEKPPED